MSPQISYTDNVNAISEIADVVLISGPSTESYTTEEKERHRRIRLLALMDQLNHIPLTNPTSPHIAEALYKDQISSATRDMANHSSIDVIEEDLSNQRHLNNALKQLIRALSDAIAQQSQENVSKSVSDEANNILQSINSIKEHNRRMSSYIKIIVNEYIFGKELSNAFKDYDDASIKSLQQRFLKLLESLLNNNILNPNSSNPTYITVATTDDTLVRYLLLNRIIETHPRNNLKIKLMDLSVDI